jgi:hypothetical protein
MRSVIALMHHHHDHGHVGFIEMKTPVSHRFDPSTQAAPKPPRA